MVRIAVAVKSQHLYNKIRKIFVPPTYEVTRNISHKTELQEFVLGDEADIAIVDGMLSWSQIAVNTLREYKIDVLLFEGDFDQIEEEIRRKFPVVTSEESGQGKEEDAETVAASPPKPVIPEHPVPPSVSAKEQEPPSSPPPADPPPSSAQTERLQQELEELRRKLSETERESSQRLKDLERQHREEVERLKNQPPPDPERIEVQVEVEGPERYRAIPQQFIVVGGLYRGVGSTFLSIALAKVLDSMNIQTLVMEFPRNEPYLYYRLGGQQKLPRNYAFFYPQMLGSQKASPLGQREEWVDGNITWLPADPSTGPLDSWTNDHMRKAVYRAKQTITILDVGTAWLDPALEDVLAQAHHTLLIAGPDPAKLASRHGKNIVAKLREEQLDVSLIANFVPDPVLPKTKEWFDHVGSFSFPILCRFPCLSQNEIIKSTWDCNTIFDQNEVMLHKAYNHFLPLIKNVVPPNLMVNLKGNSGGLLTWLFGGKKAKSNP